MLQRFIWAIFAGVFFCFSYYAQRCPFSERTIFVLVQNGTEAKNVRYELFPIRPKSAGDDFDKVMEFVRVKLNYGGVEASSIINGRRSRRMLTESAESILRGYDPAEYKPVGNLVKNDLKGKINGGKLVFNASEASQNLFILKITSDNFDPVYYAGDFFGGCRAIDRVILMKYQSWPEY